MDERDEMPDLTLEVTAMKEVAEALKRLSPEGAARVVRWAMDAHRVGGSKASGRTGQGHGGEARVTAEGNGHEVEFGTLAELFAAADPQTDVDKTLVAAYWTQFKEGATEFTAQQINNDLKHLGHGIANITSALDNLKAKKPALVIQLKKSGTSRQARKTFKVTVAGKEAVELLVGQQR